eukprot:2070562-Heterocapsa_arctica.AAC.1
MPSSSTTSNAAGERPGCARTSCLAGRTSPVHLRAWRICALGGCRSALSRKGRRLQPRSARRAAERWA